VLPYIVTLLVKTLHWLDSHAGAVQAVSALVVAILTSFLVSLTRRYVKGTNDALALSRDQLELVGGQASEQKRALELSREQFEREWQPNLRIADICFSPGQACLLLANLARPAALIKELKIGTGGSSRQDIQPQDVDSFPMTHLAQGGQIYEWARIHEQLSNYRGRHNPPPVPLNRSQWQSLVNVAVVYDCATEEDIQTEWFDCTVDFEDYTVTNAKRYEA